MPMAEYEGFAMVPYNALAAGLLTGKYLEGGTGRLDEAAMYKQRYANPQYVEITKRFVAHAKDKGVSPAALALAWVNSHPLVTSAIFGARMLDQFNDTLTCLEHRLSLEERQKITALSIDPPRATDRESMNAMKQRGW
ncbi:MAG: aldo/keto reductase, partial [Candidatus Hydrogenedentes bacterium]|nr:aldo/keto reductase [Candidatus Hydrogenedentota bacterium]